MSISTEKLYQTLQTLKEALALYDSATKKSPEQLAFRDACLQRFEYCIELSWKTSMRLLGSTTSAAKPAIREMARSNLITEPKLWIDFIESRNETSHSYDEKVATRVFKLIRSFIPEADKLLEHIKKLS